MDMAPEDITRSEQEARGQPTVREQLAAALEAGWKWMQCICDKVSPGWRSEPDFQPMIKQMETALDRHRAEPPADFKPCNCDGPDCPSYQDGYADGLEAQRERVGGGTA